MNRRVLFITIIAIVLLSAIGVGAWMFFGASFSPEDIPVPTPTQEVGTLPQPSPNPDGPFVTADPSGAPVAFRGICPDTWPGQEDSDRDLLPDAVETIYGTDIQKTDTDGDTYSDGEEVRAGYNPIRADASARLDSDSDDLLDHEECIWRTDPFNPDSDADTFTDGAEVANGFDPAKKGDGHGSDRIATATPNPVVTPFVVASTPVVTQNPDNPVLVTPIPPTQAPAVAQLSLIPVSQLKITTSTSPADVREYLIQIDSLRPAEFADGQAIANAIQSAATGNTQPLAQVRQRIAQFASALKGVSTPQSAAEYHQLYVSLMDFTVLKLQLIEQNASGDQQKAVQAALDMQSVLPSNVSRLSQLRLAIDAIANQ